MHYPVLCAEALEFLAILPEGIYVDATAGLGGHTREIARRLTTGFVIANDRDAESLEFARANTAEYADRVQLRVEFDQSIPDRIDRALTVEKVAVEGWQVAEIALA